ncbi:MAG TPA: cupin domain-containing protein [Smithellaceae bacterium]|nr:cupin domain-containing protein [Smithellaceae bacterium]HRY37535.1 cupin domain-containing protein [Smithellaceae bacterium]
MKHVRIKDAESYEASAFGFKGAEKWTLKLLSDNSIWNELGPGGCTPAEHQHDDSIERGVVLSGKGVIIHGDNRIEIQPHDFFEITDGNHQYVNTGNEPLAFMCFRYPR